MKRQGAAKSEQQRELDRQRRPITATNDGTLDATKDKSKYW
jgi:hypothetical protein